MLSPMTTETAKQLFRIIYLNDEQVYEIYAKSLAQSSMFGFIEVEELVFNTKSQMVVDPKEEKLKSEFGGVKCSYIPMHSIIRIDEVEHEGTATIHEHSDAKSTVRPFPSAVYSPPESN